MGTIATKAGSGSGTTAETVRKRIEAGGERVWRLTDFEGMPFTAVAQALSRLKGGGVIQRLGKGLYYRSRPTAFGPSKPNTAQIRGLSVRRKCVFPSGIAAANLLGFTTQNPARVEVATNGSSLPRLIRSSIQDGRSPGETFLRQMVLFSTSSAIGRRRVNNLPKKPLRSCSDTSVSTGASIGSLALLNLNRRVSVPCSGPSVSNSVTTKVCCYRCGRA